MATISLPTCPGATPLEMMQTIHKMKNIPIHEMQLSYSNQLLDDLNKPISQYGIYNGTTLNLKTFRRSGDCACAECKRMAQKVTISVEWLSKSIKVECTLGESVENLKNTIRKMEGITISRQKLQFNNQTLENHKQLASYKFEDEESGETEPVVHMLVDNGPPTMLDKLRGMVTFKGSKTPAPAATELVNTLP